MTVKKADASLNRASEREGEINPSETEIKLTRLNSRRSFLGTIGIGLAGSASLLCAPSSSLAAGEKAKAKTKQSDFKMGHGDKDHPYPNDKD